MRCSSCGLLGVPMQASILVGALLGSVSLRAEPPGSPPKLSIQEEVIASPGRTILPPVVILPGGKVLWAAKEGGRWRVFVDGKQLGEDADSVSPTVFSEDRVHSAFAVKRGTIARILVDGVERGEFTDTRGRVDFQNGSPLLVIGPDGKGVAHWTCSPAGPNKVRCSIRLLGEPARPEVDWLEPVAIGGGTPARLAYGAVKDGNWAMVVDGKDYPGPRKELLETLESMKIKVPRPFKGLVFGPGGKRFAYLSRELEVGGKTPEGIKILAFPAVAVVDGKAERASIVGLGAGIFSPFVFSPDGERVAYALVNGSSQSKEGFSSRTVTVKNVGRVVVDGVAGPTFEYAGPPPPSDSFESGESPIISRLLRPSWGGVSLPAFSPDSQHVAYVGRKGERQFVLVADGVERPLPAVDRIIGGPLYSPDGAHVACVGANEREAVVFLDEKEVSKTPVEGASLVLALTFSPDGRRTAFVVERGTSHRVVVDGKADPEFTSYPIEPLLFSPDGLHMAYVVPQGGLFGKHRVVLDGLEGKKYENVFKGSLSFSPDGRLTFLAFDAGKVLRVTQSSN